MIRRVREVLVHSNDYVRVYDDEVAFDNGSSGTHLRLEGVGGEGVVMLCLCGDRVALVRTYRYALAADQWGLPRGFGHGESPRHSALAELREEIGEEPDALELLGTVHPDSGVQSTAVHVFLASYATEVAAPTDVLEVAEVRWVPLDALWQRVARGELTDGFTLSALAMLTARRRDG